jgi:dihydroorotase
VGRAELTEKLARAAALSSAHYAAWVGATADNADEAQELCDAGLACGIKLFMGASTGPLLCDDATLVRFFERTRAILGVHAEDERLLAARREAFRAEAAPSHHAVRPTEAAVAAVGRLVELTRAHPRPVHVCHVSTGAELEILEAVRGELPITTEVAPHHLFLSTDDEDGNWTKVNPPIRPEADRRALWAAIKRGQVDTVGSDHAPHTREEKERPYWDAPAGLPGVELTFGLLQCGVKQAKLTIERMVQLCSEAPARIFGFSTKGHIAAGCDADFIVFSEAEGDVLAASTLLTRAGWSPFVGRKVVPKPERVYVAGRLIAERGAIVDLESRGSRVPLPRREPSA